jgi:hypothetical protein
MKCSDLQDKLSLCTDGFLAEFEGRSVTAHLDVCPLCRQRYAEYREIGKSLRRMGRPRVPASLKERVNRAVVAEVRARRRSWLPFAPDVREFLQMRVMPYAVGAFASVVICGSFLTLMISGVFKNTSLITQKDPTILAANHNPLVHQGEISAADLVQARLGLAGESPSINPQGTLVALTKSLVHGGMKDDEVVVVADVYGDGLAQIAEVVEPSHDRRAVGQLEKALDSNQGNTPFVPSTMEDRPDSVRVVLRFQSVDVHANSKKNSHWQ